jgi:hypothetical protein
MNNLYTQIYIKYLYLKQPPVLNWDGHCAKLSDISVWLWDLFCVLPSLWQWFCHLLIRGLGFFPPSSKKKNLPTKRQPTHLKKKWVRVHQTKYALLAFWCFSEWCDQWASCILNNLIIPVGSFPLPSKGTQVVTFKLFYLYQWNIHTMIKLKLHYPVYVYFFSKHCMEIWTHFIHFNPKIFHFAMREEFKKTVPAPLDVLTILGGVSKLWE